MKAVTVGWTCNLDKGDKQNFGGETSFSDQLDQRFPNSLKNVMTPIYENYL
jgi:hypothetical protein